VRVVSQASGTAISAELAVTVAANATVRPSVSRVRKRKSASQAASPAPAARTTR
jgi:hypothetical protein